MAKTAKKKNAKAKDCGEVEQFVKDVDNDRNVEALRKLQRVLQRKVAKRITDTLNS